MPPGPSNPEASSGEGKPQWEVPSDWKSVPASAMRYASYSVPGATGEVADLSIVTLPGEAGTDLDNVNRWRGQIGLPPIDEVALQSLVVSVKGKNGEFKVADLPGPTGRTLAAWIRLDGHTWFFKLNGPTQTVGAAKDKFARFLQSVQFHP